MSRLSRVGVFVLVALWLPVTLHCRLEAAGFFAPHDDCADRQAVSTGSDCKDDVCPAVEDALYKESAQGIQVAAPEEVCCLARLTLILPNRDLPDEPRLSPERHAPPPELGVTWQFVARAAPPARAPSLNS